MDTQSEGGWLTGSVKDNKVNFYTTQETLSSGVVRTTCRKEMKTGWRWYFGVTTLGLSEVTSASGDYLTHTYSYVGRELGGSENEAADKAYEIGCDYFAQGNYEDAKQWFGIAYVTCKSGYSRENLFREKRDAATEKLERHQREKSGQGKDQEENQNLQEAETRKEIERRAQRQKAVKQWQLSKTKLACQEVARKNCEDRALHRRDKHTVLFYSADVYQKQSQMEVKDIPDSIQFTEVTEGDEGSEEAIDDEEETLETVEVDNSFEGTKLQEIYEIDVEVEELLQLVLQNTGKEITTFQEQMFYMCIYRILVAVNSGIDLVRLFKAVCKIVTMNRMNLNDFFSIATLVISSSRLQKSLCSEQPTLLNELKSTWLHQMLTMKSIEHSESDIKKFLNVATKFNFNFYVNATQKLLRFYTKFSDLLDFFVKIQKCPLTNKSKQDFVQALTDGSRPLNLLAESLVDSYFNRKFSYTNGKQNKSLIALEFDPPNTSNFVHVVIETNDQHGQMLKLAKIMSAHFTVHWNFSHMEQLLQFIDKASKIESMVTSLLHFHDFQGSSPLLAFGEFLRILENAKAGSWTKRIHKELVELAFPQTDYSLKDELNKLKVLEQLNHFDFDNLLENLMSEKSTTLLPNGPAISKLRKDDIVKWSEFVRSGASGVSLYEIIAVVNRAVHLHSKHLPREVQNMALLLLLDKMESNTGGRLLQVNTGEGKTLIVAMFAVIMTLKGHAVDVITSSPELAKPQCEKMSSFYEYFQLTTAYVTPFCAEKIRKKVYKADIVYGAAQEFQGDILRDEYSQLGTRSGRKFDVAIVDEVDSMLIDGRNHLVMLSSPVPGMENLETLLATIWNHITTIESHLIEKNGRVYLVDGCYRINEDGSLKPEEECIENASLIEQTKLEFIKQQTENFMRMLLRDDEHLDNESREMYKNLPEMPVPHHLREFVLNVQLPKWIDSAIFAKYAYKNNQHYIIKDGEILPVDACNTGIVQANMHISNGIHQFLQIKHGAKISPETYTTNYISNVAFFKRYEKRLFGLTGTLGSHSAHELLKRMYEVDSVIIPPFKMKQYRHLSPLFADNKDEWHLAVAQSCMRQLEMGRAVLVITQYLSEVDMVQKYLKEDGLKESKIHLYKTEEHSQVVQKELQSGEIIIATNIAGRGTDISVSKEVDKHGGLHVCLTFLPVNERVEVQNFGRTSRTGNRGTGQFVVFRGVDASWDEVKRTRDEIERNRLLEAEAEIQKVLIKDAIFVEFCALLKHIRNKFGTKSRLEFENNVRSVEERFGLWLKEHEDKLESQKDFQPFCELIKQELESNTFIRNPYFHVLKGNLMMDQKDFNSAIEEYTRAIQLDDRFMSNAYYNRGYCKLALYSKSNKKEIADEAVEDFKKAKDIIEGRLERDLFLIQQSAPSSEALSEQVNHVMTLLGMQKSAIECAIGKGEGFVKREIEKFNDLFKTGKANEDEEKEYIAKLEENKVRYEQGVIGEAVQNGNGVNVILNSIESSLPAGEIASLYEREIDTFRNNGNLGSFEVTLIKPIAWGSVIGVALIGLGQIVAGAAITVFSVGAGAAIGFGMLVEGVTDLITSVVDGLINRDFSWSAWAVQKVVSYAVTIACAGLSALKNAAKVAYEGVKQTARAVTTGLTTVAKTGWKLVAKKAGLELSKGVARKLIMVGADYSLNYTAMPMVENQIKGGIQGHVKEMVDANEDVALLLETDRTNRNVHYQQQIIQKAMEILHPSSGTSNVALGLVRGLQQFGESMASNKIEGVSEAIMLVKIGKGLLDVLKVFPDFVKALKTEIASIAEQCRDAKDKPQVTKCSNVPAVEEQVKLEAIQSSHGDLTEQLCQAISSSICEKIRGSLISPLLSCAVFKGVNSITTEINNSLNQSVDVFKSQRRLIMLQDGDQHGMIDEKCKQGTKDKASAAKARLIIDNLENGGEAGLPMLGAVSDTINRPVIVLDSNENVMMYIGEDKTGDPVYVQYHEPTESHSGHWTCPNNTDPVMLGESSNNCLFAAVADQVHVDPDQLRDSVCTTLKTDRHLNLLASGARDIVHLQNCKEKYLLYGGDIKHNFKDVETTKKIIENSEGKRSQGKDGQPHGSKNHPYSHVLSEISNKDSLDKDSLEENTVNDNRNRDKTLVLDKHDQAVLTYYAMSGDDGHNAVDKMNTSENPEDRLKQCVSVDIPDDKGLPVKMVKVTKSGKKIPLKVGGFTVVMRRPLEELSDPTGLYDPDILTAYPKRAPPENHPPTPSDRPS